MWAVTAIEELHLLQQRGKYQDASTTIASPLSCEALWSKLSLWHSVELGFLSKSLPPLEDPAILSPAMLCCGGVGGALVGELGSLPLDVQLGSLFSWVACAFWWLIPTINAGEDDHVCGLLQGGPGDLLHGGVLDPSFMMRYGAAFILTLQELAILNATEYIVQCSCLYQYIKAKLNWKTRIVVPYAGKIWQRRLNVYLY